MKLYVAQREYDYEGFSIIGIFDTKEAAQEAIDNDIWEDGSKFGDDHTIGEFELNESLAGECC